MASWWIEYSREAANYLDDNGALVADLFFAIEALAETNGIPAAGSFSRLEDGEYLFEPEGHTVVYERVEPRKIVRVTTIKPN